MVSAINYCSFCFDKGEYTVNLGLRMRSNLVVRASDCQCTSCNGPGFDPSIRRHSGIWGAADEAVLNIVRTKRQKKFPQKILKKQNLGLVSMKYKSILDIHKFWKYVVPHADSWIVKSIGLYFFSEYRNSTLDSINLVVGGRRLAKSFLEVHESKVVCSVEWECQQFLKMQG